jgi:hypothetical protein
VAVLYIIPENLKQDLRPDGTRVRDGNTVTIPVYSATTAVGEELVSEPGARLILSYRSNTKGYGADVAAVFNAADEDILHENKNVNGKRIIDLLENRRHAPDKGSVLRLLQRAKFWASSTETPGSYVLRWNRFKSIEAAMVQIRQAEETRSQEDEEGGEHGQFTAWTPRSKVTREHGPLCGESMIIATDGTFKNGKGGFGGTASPIHPGKPPQRGEFFGITPGNPRDSTKCELWGVAAALMKVRMGTPLEFLIDNSGALGFLNHTAQAMWSDCHNTTAVQRCNRAHGPVKTVIEELLAQTREAGDPQPTARHVKSHQDDETKFADLDLNAQYNVRADAVAAKSEALQNKGDGTKSSLHFAGQPPVMLHWQNVPDEPLDNSVSLILTKVNRADYLQDLTWKVEFGQLARGNVDTHLLKTTSKDKHFPEDLTSFRIKAMTRQLPTPNLLARRYKKEHGMPAEGAAWCVWCYKQEIPSLSDDCHLITCPQYERFWADRREVLRKALNKAGKSESGRGKEKPAEGKPDEEKPAFEWAARDVDDFLKPSKSMAAKSHLGDDRESLTAHHPFTATLDPTPQEWKEWRELPDYPGNAPDEDMTAWRALKLTNAVRTILGSPPVELRRALKERVTVCDKQAIQIWKIINVWALSSLKVVLRRTNKEFKEFIAEQKTEGPISTYYTEGSEWLNNIRGVKSQEDDEGESGSPRRSGGEATSPNEAGEEEDLDEVGSNRAGKGEEPAKKRRKVSFVRSIRPFYNSSKRTDSTGPG